MNLPNFMPIDAMFGHLCDHLIGKVSASNLMFKLKKSLVLLDLNQSLSIWNCMFWSMRKIKFAANS